VIESLSIRDFALVQRLDLKPGRSFNVFTGETGAGKSILLQALALLLGDRASRELVRTGAEAARVEGVFNLTGACAEGIKSILEEAGIPWEEPLVISRQVTPDGRSRAHVNGASAGVGTLAEVGARLVEVSSQHQHQALLNEQNHISILDRALTPAGALTKSAYMDAYARWEKAKAEVARLKRLAAESVERREFVAFQLNEIKSAMLEAGEDDSLSEERNILVHAEKLSEAYSGAERELFSGEQAAVDILGRAKRHLERVLDKDPEAARLLELLKEAEVSLQEASEGLRERTEKVKSDPGRLEEIEDRLALIKRLSLKHGSTIEDILAKAEALERELWELENRAVVLSDAEDELASSREVLDRAAPLLSEARREAAKKLEEMVCGELEGLALGGAAFIVGVEVGPAGPEGVDEVTFLLAANPGEAPKPLAKIASGGELSRILLAVKNALRDGSVETLVFDEVDAGIGGMVAERVGERLRALAESCQVICITHLPQIAGRAGNHFLVEKAVVDGRTLTRVEELDFDMRVKELSRMLGGSEGSEAAYRHALELAKR